MSDCGCGGSANKARTARQRVEPTGAEPAKREGGPQDRGSSYYSRAGRYTGPTASPSQGKK